MHGYVGADISAVVREAGTMAIKKWISTSGENWSSTVPPEGLILQLDDLLTAMPSIRPSAMRSLFFETPPIRYTDIGGQTSVIQKLKEAIEWPLLHPEAFRRLGVKPPKGVLLYGPPGCSKTILARACACESGVNFVAVKGPEVRNVVCSSALLTRVLFLQLLNKFVGESERAVREIFRKARAASPSIIFFVSLLLADYVFTLIKASKDEIDALATSRTSSDTDQGSSHEGVLTSLLNEMDGVQELTGVTVVGATNRPESIVRIFISLEIFVNSEFLDLGFSSHETWATWPHPVRRPPWPSRKGRDIGHQNAVNDCRTGRGYPKHSRTGKRYLAIIVLLILLITEPDGGLFWSRDFILMPRSRYHHDAARYERAICEFPLLHSPSRRDPRSPSSYLAQVAQEAFLASAKTVKRQITPAVLQKFMKWRDGTTARQFWGSRLRNWRKLMCNHHPKTCWIAGKKGFGVSPDPNLSTRQYWQRIWHL